jgi:hypothetical protein
VGAIGAKGFDSRVRSAKSLSISDVAPSSNDQYRMPISIADEVDLLIVIRITYETGLRESNLYAEGLLYFYGITPEKAHKLKT